MLPYPHFPDVRGEGLNPDNPITAALGQVTLNWVSPISVDADQNQARSVTRLLSSSSQSWLSADLDIVPDYRAHPDTGFSPSGERGARLLAVAVEGRFDSFFQGKPSPLAAQEAAEAEPQQTEPEAEQSQPETETAETPVITRRPQRYAPLVEGSRS